MVNVEFRIFESERHQMCDLSYFGYLKELYLYKFKQ